MPIHGVLFDFSGTLFRFDPVPDGLVDESGRPLTAAARAEVVRRMTAPADSATADGAAAEIGCATALVDAVPVDRRPRALLDALAAHGLG
ncbi:hypothetical protein [Nocardia sp. NPDC003345]